MHRQSNLQISFLIVFFSIITVILQFGFYYFFDIPILILGVSALILVICNNVLLEKTLSYESCFIYSLLTLFISLIVTVLTYFGKAQSFIPYSGLLFVIAFTNWFIPAFHCILRNMFDYGMRIEDFSTFFRNINIVFIIFYVGILACGVLQPEAFPWAYEYTPVSETAVANYIPFNTLASQIELYIYHQIPLSDIVIYLSSRIFIFIPYGFNCYLLLRRKARIVKLLVYLLLPVLIEVIQYFYLPSLCDIDDALYGFIGAFLGAILFMLLNQICRIITGHEFLENEHGYRHTGRPLHF